MTQGCSSPYNMMVSLSSAMWKMKNKTRVGPNDNNEEETSKKPEVTFSTTTEKRTGEQSDKENLKSNEVADKDTLLSNKVKLSFTGATFVKTKVFKKNNARPPSQDQQVYKGPSFKAWLLFIKRRILGQNEIFVPYREVPISTKKAKGKAKQERAENVTQKQNSPKTSECMFFNTFLDFSPLELQDINCEPSVWSVLLMRPTQDPFSTTISPKSAPPTALPKLPTNTPRSLTNVNTSYKSPSASQTVQDTKSVIDAPKQFNDDKNSALGVPTNEVSPSNQTDVESVQPQTAESISVSVDKTISSYAPPLNMIFVQDAASIEPQIAATEKEISGKVADLTPVGVTEGNASSENGEKASVSLEQSVSPAVLDPAKLMDLPDATKRKGLPSLRNDEPSISDLTKPALPAIGSKDVLPDNVNNSEKQISTPDAEEASPNNRNSSAQILEEESTSVQTSNIRLDVEETQAAFDTAANLLGKLSLDDKDALMKDENAAEAAKMSAALPSMSDNEESNRPTASVSGVLDEQIDEIKVIKPNHIISMDDEEKVDLPLAPTETFFFPEWEKLKLNENIGKGANSTVISAKAGSTQYALKLFRAEGDEYLDGIVPSGIIREAVILLWINMRAPGVTPSFCGFVQIAQNYEYLETGLLLESTMTSKGEPAPSLLSILTAEAELRFKSGGSQVLYSTKRWLQMLINLVVALSMLHSCCVIHTDLHIGNIILPSFDRPVIIDFGEAAYNPKCHTIPLIGQSNLKIHPVAPEKILGHRPSTTWDVYSLGTIMNKVITATGMRCLNELIKECQMYNPFDRIALVDLKAKLENLRYTM